MITITTHCDDRKEMVRRLSEHLHTPAVYLRTPTYAFQIGELMVNRDASVSGEREQLLPAAECLLANGYISDIPAELTSESEIPAKEPADETTEADSEAKAIDATTIRIHEAGWELYSMKNMIRILYTRQYLINRMFKMDRLFIDDEVIELMNGMKLLCVSDLEVLIHDEARIGMIRGFNISGGTVEVDMPYDDGTTTQWMYYSQVIMAIIRQAKVARRIKVERHEPVNDKYYANAWLNRLGFGGADYKALRHALMSHLNGYAAFKDDDRMQAHKNKMAEQRRIRRDTTSEVDSSD